MSAIRDDGVLIEQGAVFRRSYTFKGLDLTGATAHLQVREKPGSEALLDLSTTIDDGSGITIEITTIQDQVASIVTVLALQDLTSDLTPGAVVFDLKVLDASNEATRLVEGRARITAQVTE